MINIITKLLFGGKDRKIEEVKGNVLQDRIETKRGLKRINKKFKLLLDEGKIEIVIRNVKGVLQDD